MCDAILVDTNEDGIISESDVPIEYDVNVNGVIDPDELQSWLNDQSILENCTYYAPEDNTWILNIADLVVSQQRVDNDGAKLLKIRFYPKATTEFIP